MDEMRKVPSLKILEKLPSPKDGERVYCEKEGAVYIYNNSCWGLDAPVEIDSGLTLLELNRSVIKNMEPLNMLEVLEDHIDQIDKWKMKTNNTFYMLYGKEISYFTLFNIQESKTETLGEAVFDCLSDIGPIYSFSQEPGGFEIWAKPEDKEVTVFYLFPYDTGVLEVQ